MCLHSGRLGLAIDCLVVRVMIGINLLEAFWFSGQYAFLGPNLRISVVARWRLFPSVLSLPPQRQWDA